MGAVLGLALLAKAYLLALVPAVLLRRRSVYDLAPAALIAGWWYVRNVMLGLPFTGWIQHADTAQAIAAIVHIQWLRVMQVIGNTFIWFSAWSFLTLKAWMYALVEIIAVGAGMVAGVSSWRRRDAALNTAFAFAGCFALATLYGVRVGYSIQKIAAVPGWYAWSIVTALAVILASGLGRATIAMVAVLALIDIYGVVARLTPFYAGLVEQEPRGGIAVSGSFDKAPHPAGAPDTLAERYACNSGFMYTVQTMVRSFAAVICGYIVTGILIFATDQTFAATVPGFNDMPMPPRFYFLISICTDTLYSVLGGWTCAAIAKTRVRDRVLALIALGELVGVVSTIALWEPCRITSALRCWCSIRRLCGSGRCSGSRHRPFCHNPNQIQTRGAGFRLFPTCPGCACETQRTTFFAPPRNLSSEIFKLNLPPFQ